jgi:hypothetical protein
VQQDVGLQPVFSTTLLPPEAVDGAKRLSSVAEVAMRQEKPSMPRKGG